MKTLLCCALVLAQLAFAGAAVAGQGKATSTDEVLDGMARALGGRERLARLTSVSAKVRIEAAGLTGSGEGLTAMDGRTRSSYDLGGVDSGASVFDGKHAWVLDGNGKVREQAGPELESEITAAYLGSFSHLVKGRMAGRAALAGEDADRTHYVLKIEPQGGHAVTLFVDKTTYLVDRAEQRTGDRTSISISEDWRDVDGVKFAFRSRQRSEGDKTETVITVTEIRLDAPVDATAFRKPEERAPDFAFSNGSSAVAIPFELTSNHIYLKASVNGSEPLWFLFDTGAGASVINTPRAKALGLKLEGQFQARGSGEGTLDASVVRGVKVALPGVEVAGQTVYTIPLTGLEPFEGRSMDGILGYDFTSRFVVEIDYAAKRISFHDPKTYVYRGKGERFPIDLRRNTSHVRATISEPGREPLSGVFIVDTGARSALSLNTPFVAANPWVGELSNRAIPAPFGIGVGGEAQTRVGRLATLKLGSYAVENLVTGFSVGTKGAEAETDNIGNIGGEVLRRFTVVFDYSRSAMYLEPNASIGDPMEYDMLGAMLKLDSATPSGFSIHRVIDRTAASDVGLRVGDVIVAIDGRPSSEFTLDQVRKMFRTEPGHAYTLGVRRGAETVEVKVTLRRIV